MTAFLIVISVMLNIIALMAIVILFLRQNKLLKVESDQKKAMIEIEELMSSYLLEMKDENERFIGRAKKINKEKSKGEHFSVAPVAHHQQVQNSLVEKEENQGGLTAHLGKTISFQAVKAYQKQKKGELESDTSIEEKVKIREKTEEIPLKSEQKDVHNLTEESLFDQIKSMKQQGLSEEEVAKKLNKGRTEIALLLKFRGNQ